MAKEIKREGKIEDILIEQGRKHDLQLIEAKVKDQLNERAKADRARPNSELVNGFDYMYEKGKDFMMRRDKSLLKIRSEIEKDSFKPKINKCSKNIVSKVTEIRKSYDLTKEHWNAPILAQKKKRTKLEAEKSLQEFLARNAAKEEERQKKIEDKIEEASQQELASLSPAPKYQSKKSKEILATSSRYQGTSLLERRRLYMEEKERKRSELRSAYKPSAYDSQSNLDFRSNHQKSRSRSLAKFSSVKHSQISNFDLEAQSFSEKHREIEQDIDVQFRLRAE